MSFCTVDRVSMTLPQLHVAVMSEYVGWMPGFTNASLDQFGHQKILCLYRSVGQLGFANIPKTSKHNTLTGVRGNTGFNGSESSYGRLGQAVNNTTESMHDRFMAQVQVWHAWRRERT